MNVSSAFTNFIKIVFLLLLILVVMLGGVFWFDHLGLINYKKLVRPYERFLPPFMRRGESAAEDPLLMERAFISITREMTPSSDCKRPLNK